MDEPEDTVCTGRGGTGTLGYCPIALGIGSQYCAGIMSLIRVLGDK